MKKILLFLLVMTSFSVSVTNAQRLRIGVKGGADMKKLSGKSFDDQFSYGYHLGAFAEIKLFSKLGIQPEVYFSQVNIDTSSSFSDIYDFEKVSKAELKYINIPVLLSFKPSKYIAIQAGPQFGILMDKGNTVLKNGQNAFSKGDLSMLAGIQLQFSKLRIYARYGIGLNNINDIDNREQWKSQTIHAGLGLAF